MNNLENDVSTAKLSLAGITQVVFLKVYTQVYIV